MDGYVPEAGFPIRHKEHIFGVLVRQNFVRSFENLRNTWMLYIYGIHGTHANRKKRIGVFAFVYS